ncbi:MAG: hypothetical protein ACRDT4_00855 [Micromonosporaceae bacterium]
MVDPLTGDAATGFWALHFLLAGGLITDLVMNSGAAAYTIAHECDPWRCPIVAIFLTSAQGWR